MFVVSEDKSMVLNLDQVICLKSNPEGALVAVLGFYPPNGEVALELYKPKMSTVGGGPHPSTLRVMEGLVKAMRAGQNFYDISKSLGP